VRRSALAFGALLLLGASTACDPPWQRSALGTVHPGTVSKSIASIGSLSVGPVALIPFDQPGSDLVKPGQPVQLSFESVPGLHLIGTVKDVVPIRSAIAQKIIYHAVVEIAGADARVRPGQYVRAVVATESVPNALVVPNDAVRPDGAASYVTSADGTRLTFTPGLVGDDVTEVRGGLSEGQQVRLR
jgi:HlyD family secretion protein